MERKTYNSKERRCHQWIHWEVQKLFIISYYSQLSADINMKNYKIKTSFLSLAWMKSRAKKTGLNFMICHLNIRRKIGCNAMPYIIFQYGWELVLIQRIFEAILEMFLPKGISLFLLGSHFPNSCGLPITFWNSSGHRLDLKIIICHR